MTAEEKIASLEAQLKQAVLQRLTREHDAREMEGILACILRTNVLQWI
jgi:hypothetical protein